MKIYWTTLTNIATQNVLQAKNFAEVMQNLPKSQEVYLIEVLRTLDYPQVLQCLQTIFAAAQSGTRISISETHMPLVCGAVASDTVKIDEIMGYFKRSSFVLYQTIKTLAENTGFYCEFIAIGTGVDHRNYEIVLVKS